MAKVRWPIVGLGMIGLLWLGQGIGLIPGSFMTGDPVWAVIGAVMVLAAVVLTLSIRRGR